MFFWRFACFYCFLLSRNVFPMFWEVLVARIRACTHSPRKNLVYAFDQRKNKKTVKMLVFKVVHVYLNIHICTDSLCPTWIKSGSFAVRVSETTLPTLHHLVIANSLWLRCLFFAWPLALSNPSMLPNTAP